MRIVLRIDTAGLGNKGDVLDVADGYARNYLLPKGLALKASKGAELQAKSMRRSRDVKDSAARGAAEVVATTLVPAVITVEARSGAEGKLFGSVTTAEISDAIAAQTGIEVDRKDLHLAEPIRSLGTHLVPTKLHADVEFSVTVEVVAS